MKDHTRKTREVRGSMTALVTPFCGEDVDWTCVDALVDRQVEGGADWVVPLGTTGETPTLCALERQRLLSAVVERVAGRCGVMAGTGSSSTKETVQRSRQAQEAGADAVLVVAPPYNRPTSEGMFRHFSAVAEAIELPIVLYNVPARTGSDIPNEVIVRLSDSFANVVAVKDATGNVDRVTDLQNRRSISVLSGDDAMTWPLMALGAVGVISVVGNLAPELMKSLVEKAAAGDVPGARQTHRKVYDLAMRLGRFGPNPIPIKTAMSLAGLLAEEFRLPLCPLDEAERNEIGRILVQHELIERVSK